MPTEGTTTFVDEIYGEITVENKELDDIILIKLGRVNSLFAGGELDEDAKDVFFQAIMSVYMDSKKTPFKIKGA